MARKRDLTWDERRTWGECPACDAEDGEPCDPGVGIHMGNVPKNGVHLGRLQRAPKQIEEVPA